MKLSRTIMFAFTICLAVTAGSLSTVAQDPDFSKGFESTAYKKKRQKFSPSGTSSSTSGPTASKRRYYRPKRPIPRTLVKPTKAAARATELADIGFTLWKFERVNEGDDPKILKEIDPKTDASIAARRADSESMLSVGDVVRIGIESGSHPGYLYVINREKYSDGTFGKSRLIYPKLASSDGRNFVRPGLLRYFPSPEGHFRIDSDSKTKQYAEELIVIVSPKEIIDADRLRRGPLDLTDAEVTGWLNKWGVEVAKLELDGGAGDTMTEAERRAGEDQTEVEEQKKSLSLVSSLTADDAEPQTLYRMRIKRGNPVLARIELRINPK